MATTPAARCATPGAPRAASYTTRWGTTNLSYAPYILKADISQCFPSIYTHSISWAAHGIEQSKNDTRKDSSDNVFNALDFFVRNSQRGNTRGVLIGPDAYRLIAEFVLARIDNEIWKEVGNTIVGAVRHVDDYYIGLRSEHDAQSVLSHLREVLASYELNLNDHKTKIYSSLEPVNDLWAQRLRDHMKMGHSGLSRLKHYNSSPRHDETERAISEAVATANEVGSDSPVKILFRSLDEVRVYNSPQWYFVEQNIQRIIQKHPHVIDYACLLVAKRSAIGSEIHKDGWLAVSDIIIKRSLALNHHHETAWMLWLLIVCEIPIHEDVAEALAKSPNSHIRALLVQAYVEEKIARKPKLALGSALSTVDSDWLVNLVARSQGFSKAKFSGLYAEEFEHLAKRQINLVNFTAHIESITEQKKGAISRVRYGYDSDEEDNAYDYPDLEGHDFDPSAALDELF